LFENGNSADLAAAIGRLLDDPQRRATLSAAASAAVRDYDWPKIARDVVKVYKAVLPAGSPAASDPVIVLGRAASANGAHVPELGAAGPGPFPPDHAST
jgi:phosphatidylinositol alpha-mannosyltransferase